MGRFWPLFLVLAACGASGAFREARSAKVTADLVKDQTDEHQHGSSALPLRVDGKNPVHECPSNGVHHAILDKDSEGACQLHGGLTPRCSDLSGLIVFLNETRTRQNFTILGDGKIDVYLKESKLGEFGLMYKCYSSNKSEYAFKKIGVGNPPSDVQNLTCISANLEYLNCSWRQPYNPAQNNDYGAYLYNRTWHCNYGRDQCVANTSNGYRPEDPSPPLIFSTENVLGPASFTHTIDNWAAMLPKPAEDFAVEEKSPMKISVTWTSPSPLRNFPPGLFYRLDLRGLNHSVSTMTTVGKYSNSSTWEVETQVPFPWLTYEIKLRLRSGRRNATTDAHWEDGWSSEPVHEAVEIKPAAPWAAPEVDVGTFRVNRSADSSRMELTAMWRRLPPLLHNGPGLRYVVMCSNYSKIVNTTEPMATFPNLPTGSYRVTIKPENTEGPSNETSHIDINEKLPPTPALSVVVFHRTTKQYELRWEGESNYTYTVYVCIDDTSSKDCKGNLYWKGVGRTSAVNITLQEMNISQSASKPRFALSAENEARESSGMAWDTCARPQDYDSKPKSPVIEITETDESVILSWSLSCTNRSGIVEKAEASWGPKQHNCSSQISSELQIPKHELQRDTNYTICLRLLYRSGYSDWSTTTYSIGKDSIPIGIIVLLASISVVVVTVLVLVGKRIFRHIHKAHKELTRHINMPSVLSEEGEGATLKDQRGSHCDLGTPCKAPEEVKQSPKDKTRWRATDDKIQETKLRPEEKEKQAYIFGMSHAEGQQGGSCAGYVLAHDPEERPDAGAPSRRAEGTSVELCDKKGDCSPPFTSKGYVQCSAITERLDSFQ
ncbi:uncharacterized protein [Penaeus vannamei]|uniref:uncharacterized protein n=1 Tax=Penaeus vannamei TaxID=6689 RepID=UPI00387F4DD4